MLDRIDKFILFWYVLSLGILASMDEPKDVLVALIAISIILAVIYKVFCTIGLAILVFGGSTKGLGRELGKLALFVAIQFTITALYGSEPLLLIATLIFLIQAWFLMRPSGWFKRKLTSLSHYISVDYR